MEQQPINQEKGQANKSSFSQSAFDGKSGAGQSMMPPPFQLKDHSQGAEGVMGHAPIQRVLQVTGNQAHIDRVLAILNRTLFGYSVAVDASGIISITRNGIVGPPTPAQQAIYDRLNGIIGHAQTTTIGVQSADPNTLIGSYASGQIDIADIEAMAGNTGATDSGTLIHELVEQYRKQVHGEGYNQAGHGERSGAHGEGIVAEEELNGMTRGTHSVVSQTTNPDGSVTVIVDVPYTRPDGKTVTTRLTIVNNNVTSTSERISP